jgi:orotidine-5'-phosphate decarboxylase
MLQVASRKSQELIVALDVADLEKAKRLVDVLYPRIKLFKVGSQLFTAYGPEAVKMIGQKGAKVFLDLKFHDIPNTVYGAVASGTSSTIVISPLPTGLGEVNIEDQVKKFISYPVFMMTVHTLGGREMLKAAVKGALEKAAELKIPKPYLVGVTVLTSEGLDAATPEKVLGRARLAKEVGLDGVVCAVSEAAMIRKEFGKDFIIVTPGIRPRTAKADDQKRTSTFEEAVKTGSDFIVIGRPILEAADPLKALEEILKY